MDVSEKYFDFATGAKEVSQLDLPYLVSMRPADSFKSCLPWAQSRRSEVCQVRDGSSVGRLWRTYRPVVAVPKEVNELQQIKGQASPYPNRFLEVYLP